MELMNHASMMQKDTTFIMFSSIHSVVTCPFRRSNLWIISPSFKTNKVIQLSLLETPQSFLLLMSYIQFFLQSLQTYSPKILDVENPDVQLNTDNIQSSFPAGLGTKFLLPLV